MPINKIVATKRGKGAIATIMAAAISVGGVWFAKAPDGHQYPAAVVLAVDHLLIPWEDVRTHAYKDAVGIPTICVGETKGVRMGMVKTRQECIEMAYARAYQDFYLPMTKCVKGLETKPIGPQAAMISGAYNFGVGRWCHSTAARLVAANQFRKACEAQTAFNKAAGKILSGLVARREMGDRTRPGEAEICVSGL